jgi:hypothetical protein
VPTPSIVAYAVYPAGLVFRRSDVASVEIAGSVDLADILTRADEDVRRKAMDATATLIGQLARSGARHHDLNVKNVLLAASESTELTAYVLDVDRVEFGTPGDHHVAERNLARFMRSARKWRDVHGARIDEADLDRVVASVRSSLSLGVTIGERLRTRS